MTQYIVAGHAEEFRHWVSKNKLDANPPVMIYVSGIDMLRGHSNICGRFIGTYRHRPDILDIIQQIIVSKRGVDSGVLIKLYNEIKQERGIE